MKCPSCQYENPPGMRFCVECGTQLEVPNTISKPVCANLSTQAKNTITEDPSLKSKKHVINRPKPTNRKWLALTGGVLLVALISACIVWLRPAKNPPERATAATPFTNSLGMKFVPVPITGGPSVGEKILFSIWETRRKDFDAYYTENPDVNASWRNVTDNGAPAGHEPDHPAVCVTWNQAKAFCKWLTVKERKEGWIDDSLEYRLPSDHEWSCAVGHEDSEDWSTTPEDRHKVANDSWATMAVKRARGESSKYQDQYWGAFWPPPLGFGNFSDKRRAEEITGTGAYRIEQYTDGYATTSPVGSFAAERFGLFDIAGNANEWCEDWFNAKHDSKTLRGGSYTSYSDSGLSPLMREEYPPGKSLKTIGFRCVLAPVQ